MEIKKFHSLPSASWQTKSPSGRILSESKGLRIRGSRWCKSQSKAKGPRTRSSSIRAKGGNPAHEESEFVVLSPFGSIWAPTGWADIHPHWGGQWDLLLIASKETLTDTPRNKVLPLVWASLRPDKLICKTSWVWEPPLTASSTWLLVHGPFLVRTWMSRC